MWPFRREPAGFTLIRSDGRRHNRIRGDLIPADSLVIVEDGRHFVRAGERDEVGFEVYSEGHRTFSYRSVNSDDPAATVQMPRHLAEGDTAFPVTAASPFSPPTPRR